MKVNITVNDDLMKRIDKYVKENYTNRSSFFSFSALQVLNSQDVVTFIRELTLAVKKVADSGVIDDETVQKLEDFERLAKMLLSNSPYK